MMLISQKIQGRRPTDQEENQGKGGAENAKKEAAGGKCEKEDDGERGQKAKESTSAGRCRN
jgi:hypothetical protein